MRMMEDANADDDTRILFMDTILGENEKLRGGAVLTDIRTEPIEFRCTDTVSPNRLQRTLWGKRLRGHLTVEIIGKPLVESFKQPLSLVVVQKPEFLELRTTSDVPHVLATSDESNAPLPSFVGERVPLNLGNGNLLQIAAHRDFQDDAVVGAQMLERLSQYSDVLNPFERVLTALKIIEDQESKGQSATDGDGSRRSM